MVALELGGVVVTVACTRVGGGANGLRGTVGVNGEEDDNGDSV